MANEVHYRNARALQNRIEAMETQHQKDIQEIRNEISALTTRMDQLTQMFGQAVSLVRGPGATSE